VSALASVVIPAHNEQRGISRTLRALHTGLEGSSLDVVVVCNGCTDDTAATVRREFPWVRVLEISTASKADAVECGNAATSVFPRLHLDADVVLSGSSVLELVAAFGEGVHAVAPRRVLDRTGASMLVAWYYDVWQELPQVEGGLFGRGAFMLTEEGQRRVTALPRMMSDDLVVSEAFASHERRIVDGAESIVTIPRRLPDLVRRRVRSVTGNAQADSAGTRSADAMTRPSTLLRISASHPSLVLKMPVFLGVAAVARLRARSAVRAGDFGTWLRDESSRE
jgi:hypothetical protein